VQNIDLTTLYYSDLFPETKFVYVEPFPDNVSLMRKYIGFLGTRLKEIDLAVSSKNVFLYFKKDIRS